MNQITVQDCDEDGCEKCTSPFCECQCHDDTDADDDDQEEEF